MEILWKVILEVFSFLGSTFRGDLHFLLSAPDMGTMLT